MSSKTIPLRVVRDGSPTLLREGRVVSSGRGRFRPRARLIRTIGAELISSEIVAVLELVRNGYDADARTIDVRFTQPHEPELAVLEITDNGHGMPKDVLLGPWLEPATPHKTAGAAGELAGDRSPRGRRRLGSKGVGRFATQRLGRHLVVRTSTGGTTQFEADFDWDSLDRADRYLDQLRVPWHEVRARQGWKGTALIIRDLRDVWTEERFERLRVALSRLVGPGLGDERFRIRMIINGAAEIIRPTIESLPSMYGIEGRVRPGGLTRIRYFDISGAKETWERNVLWPPEGQSCGAFRFRVNAWDLDREALEYFFQRAHWPHGPREFRRLIRDHSGVSLYRDGFRILPYGEPDNDWLRLDRRRVNNPTLRLSNNQILGWIQITAQTNALLQDQTNREGLVANQAYTHLQQVVLELLGYLEARRFQGRRALGLAHKTQRLELHEVSGSGVEFEHLLDDLTTRKSLGQADVARLRSALELRSQVVANAMHQYAALAAAAQLSGVAATQIGHRLRQIETGVELIAGELPHVDGPSAIPIQKAVEGLQIRLRDLKRVLEKLDPMLRSRGITRIGAVQLARCAADVADVFTEQFARGEILFELDAADSEMALADHFVVQQVLGLLFDNAIYWLGRIKPPRLLTVRVAGGRILVQNNGPTITATNAAHLFDAYFSTREGATGMGLTIARDLLTSIGGTIRIVPNSRGAGFEIKLTRPASQSVR